MAKKNKSSSSKKSAAKASAKQKRTEVVTSNARLVEALKTYTASMLQTKSYLVDAATICQEEQLTKNEIVASFMEARGIKKQSAESQFSRLKGILMNPEILEKVKSGEMDLATARQSTVNKQKSPSVEKKKENLQKRFQKAIAALMLCAKEGPMDLTTIVTAVKLAAKKNGIK